MHHELVLMLLADARLPVGGHTQSGTVEAALAHGLTAHDVPAYLRTRLRSVTLVEAGSAVVARHRAACGGDLADVDVAWAARTPSSALRQASRGQGRTLRRLAGLLWPEALAPLHDLLAPSRATVLGAVAAHLGLPAGSLARLVGYDDVQTVCAAALKLAPLDPAVATGWVAAALPEIAALAAEVADLTSPGEIPAVGCPQIEVWAQAHAVTNRRLFRA
ncbi:urease accessory protein UreF [Nocardioides pelophilus]|uniref:urease accessory protein UreF n=1 Tax=Nocardioides pelophilus TaxID=2172019 RepID=UPI001FEAE291|nr:urease accessory UreF family protein [Nocardioides pelophilus]